MRIKILLAALLLLGVCSAEAQRVATNQTPASGLQPQPQDAGAMLTNYLASIAQSVQSLNQMMTAFIERSAPAGGATMTDKRQKIVAGLQALTTAEQRVIIFQNNQYDLTNKLNDARAKLSQTEVDMRPQRIDRPFQLEGSPDTPELREARKDRLSADKVTLTNLVRQLQDNLDQNTVDLREAQLLARNLRKTYIPQLEKELSEQ